MKRLIKMTSLQSVFLAFNSLLNLRLKHINLQKDIFDCLQYVFELMQLENFMSVAIIVFKIELFI